MGNLRIYATQYFTLMSQLLVKTHPKIVSVCTRLLENTCKPETQNLNIKTHTWSLYLVSNMMHHMTSPTLSKTQTLLVLYPSLLCTGEAVQWDDKPHIMQAHHLIRARGVYLFNLSKYQSLEALSILLLGLTIM